MPLADKFSPAPREVRAAGVLASLPGLALLAFGVAVLIDSFGESVLGPGVYAQVGVFLLIGASALWCAGGLVFGQTWARSPVLVVALLTLGIGWYATGPSGQAGFGVPVMVVAVAIVVLLFRRPSRAWALGQLPGESEEQAAERGGAAGRRARRENRDETL